MRVLRSIVDGICGLFVDDGLFALAVVVWVAAGAVACHYAGRASWLPYVFFSGIAILLVIGTLRQAGRARR